MYHMNKKNFTFLCVAVVMAVALLSLKEAKAENMLNVREFVMIERFTPIEIRLNSTIAPKDKNNYYRRRNLSGILRFNYE